MLDMITNIFSLKSNVNTQVEDGVDWYHTIIDALIIWIDRYHLGIEALVFGEGRQVLARQVYPQGFNPQR